MGIIGVLWLILIVLKICAVIATSWWIILLWPIAVFAILFLITLLFGVTVAGVMTRWSD